MSPTLLRRRRDRQYRCYVSVARGNHQHPKAHDVSQAVDDAFRCARIGEARGQAIGDTKAPFDLAQRWNASI